MRLAIEAQLFDFFFAAAGFCPVAAELLASFECAAIAGPAPVALRMSPLCCLSSDFLRPKPKKYLPKNPIFSSLAVYAMPVNCCLSISFPGKADSSRERRQPFFYLAGTSNLISVEAQAAGLHRSPALMRTQLSERN